MRSGNCEGVIGRGCEGVIGRGCEGVKRRKERERDEKYNTREQNIIILQTAKNIVRNVECYSRKCCVRDILSTS